METAAMGKDLVGTVIDGRFTLIQWLGGSAAADVFLTEADGQRAAIKLILAEGADAEARIAAWAATNSLAHPHLARLLHTGHCPDGPAPLVYAVTEYSGELLSQIIPERPLTPAEVREMLDPILDALSYLHSKGVVHGHLKPSNIMVVDDQLKISTDSLHIAGESAVRPTAPDIYHAPELAEGRVLPAADLWSLGMTLVESLTQQPPLWLRPEEINPRAPKSIEPPFAEIIRECLRSDSTRRCTLGGFRALLNPAPFIPNPPGKAVKTQPAKFPAKVLITAVVVLIVVVAALELRSRNAVSSLQTGGESAPAVPAAPAQSPAPARESPVPAEQSTTPVPQSPASATQVVEGPPIKGDVAERVLPEVLPSAQASIDHQVNVGVRVAVDAAGNVSKATFESAGPSKYFARQAMQAAQHWRFKPAQANGKAVSSTWILRFHFTQSGTEVTPVEVSP
jgi:TonB family protein